jgi:hypothetical protein
MSSLARLGYETRKRLPAWLRRTLRLGKLALLPGQHSTPLPAELLEDCRMVVNRHEMVKRLPPGGRVAEVGTFTGAFSRHILDTCAPDELHLVDLDFGALDPSVAADPRVRKYQGLSHDRLAAFPDAHFDWIYIDAGHGYADVIRDANTAGPKVKPGGYLVFNDFAHMDPYLGAYGVHRAVVEFAAREGWPFRFWAYEPSALYDVALQRPG